MNSELNDLQTSEVKHPAKSGLRGVFRITAFACLAMCFIGSFVYDQVRIRNAKRSHEKYTTELRDFDEARMQLKRAETQAKKTRGLCLMF